MIHHGDTEARSERLHEELTERVIGAAIDAHRGLGPGLLESAYEKCLCHELHLHSISFGRQVSLRVEYKEVHLDRGYRIDLGVERSLVLELECAKHVLAGSPSSTPHIFEIDRQARRINPEFQCFGLEAASFVKFFRLRASVTPW